METVIQVRPLENLRLEMQISTGESRVFDAKPYLKKGTFQGFQDEELVRRAYVALDTVCWPGGLDIAPETLYAKSEPKKVGDHYTLLPAGEGPGMRASGHSGSFQLLFLG